MTKDELLALLDDPDVRAKLLVLVDPVRLKADVVEAVREDAAASAMIAIDEADVTPISGVIRSYRVSQANKGQLRVSARTVPPWLQR